MDLTAWIEDMLLDIEMTGDPWELAIIPELKRQLAKVKLILGDELCELENARLVGRQDNVVVLAERRLALANDRECVMA